MTKRERWTAYQLKREHELEEDSMAAGEKYHDCRRKLKQPWRAWARQLETEQCESRRPRP
jgi:hypothetical protein